MVRPRVCSARRGKLNRCGPPAAMVQFKINTVDSGSLPELCPRGQLEWSLISHYCSTRKGLLKRMRRHWPSFHWKKLPVGAVHPVGAGIAAAPAKGLIQPRWNPYRLWYSSAQTHVSGHPSFSISNRTVLQLPLQASKCQLKVCLKESIC